MHSMPNRNPRILTNHHIDKNFTSKYSTRLSLLTYQIMHIYIFGHAYRTGRQIFICQNGISVTESPLRRMVQSSEN